MTSGTTIPQPRNWVSVMFTQRLKNLVERLIPDALTISPSWLTLESGLRVRIDSKLTLELFVELFVTQPYRTAMVLAKNPQFIVDIGANRGFFMLYATDYLEHEIAKTVPEFLCIEGASQNAERLMEHVRANELNDRVTIINGAVCDRRTGSVEFFYSPKSHGMGGITTKRLTSQTVPVVDLARLTDNRTIDLLKIDIEGAEEGVLEEYADVLARTNVLTGEFHLKRIDYPRCQRLLNASGLEFHSRPFVFEDKLTVDVYVRPAVHAF